MEALRYELAHPKRVTSDEMIESMNFGHTGDGGPAAKGHVSNKTLYIAANYMDRADVLNAEASGEVIDLLCAMEDERKRLLRLKKQSYIVVSDIYAFAELRREPRDQVSITFYWMNVNCFDDSLGGWRQTVSLPLEDLMDFALRGGVDGYSGDWKVLSVKDAFSPRIVFVDHRNLKDTVANITVRRKLAKFLSRNFHYRNATEIRLFNDFVPYSFFFREMIGEQTGMCGGMILHGQDDLKTAKYSIHT